MRDYFPRLDLVVRRHQEHRAGAVERGIDDRENRELWRNRHHTAGLVLRRFTIRNASPNMNSEKSTNVAREAVSENSPWLAGYIRSRSA